MEFFQNVHSPTLPHAKAQNHEAGTRDATSTRVEVEIDPLPKGRLFRGCMPVRARYAASWIQAER